VITAYALAFGSVLLLGGRLADLLGRKAMFLAGLAGFAVASAVGAAGCVPGCQENSHRREPRVTAAGPAHGRTRRPDAGRSLDVAG
jgi:MFS family permease